MSMESVPVETWTELFGQVPNTAATALFGPEAASATIAEVAAELLRWREDARILHPPARLAMWTAKREALIAIIEAGQIENDIHEAFEHGTPEMLLEEIEAERARASVSARHARAQAIDNGNAADGDVPPDSVRMPAEQSLPSWVRLGETSTRWSWAPLQSHLDYAMQTVGRGGNPQLQRRWAAVCREDPAAAEYCERHGRDISFEMPISPSTLSEQKRRVERSRETQRRL